MCLKTPFALILLTYFLGFWYNRLLNLWILLIESLYCDQKGQRDQARGDLAFEVQQHKIRSPAIGGAGMAADRGQESRLV